MMKEPFEKIHDLAKDITEDEFEKLNKFRKKNGTVGNLIIIFTTVLIAFITFVFVKDLLVSGISTSVTAFKESAKISEKDAYDVYYNEAYQKAYDKALSENVINNDVYISVDGVQEMSTYEVFTVIEDATITETEEQKSNGIYAWKRFKGKGVFTIDLQQSEILVDHENLYVNITIPLPKMSYSLLENETKDLLFIDEGKQYFLINIKSDISVGYDIAREQEQKATEVIYNKIMDNEDYFVKAKEAAKTSLANLVKALNPKIADDLTIVINFNE